MLQDKEVIKNYEMLIDDFLDTIMMVCKSYEYLDLEDFVDRAKELEKDYLYIKGNKMEGE